MSPLQTLLHSRKFLLTLGDAIVSIALLTFAQFDPSMLDYVQKILVVLNGLYVVMVMTITAEDVAAKLRTGQSIGRDKINLIPLFFAIGIAAALISIVVSPVFADGPIADEQPWMYSALHCTGLGSVSNVRAAWTEFQNQQAADHNYSPDAWQSNYSDDVRLFVQKLGCTSGGLRDGAMTFDFKLYFPIYARAMRAITEQ